MPLNFGARVDILMGTKIMSLAFINPILDLSRRDIKMYIGATLNSPAQVDTFRY